MYAASLQQLSKGFIEREGLQIASKIEIAKQVNKITPYQADALTDILNDDEALVPFIMSALSWEPAVCQAAIKSIIDTFTDFYQDCDNQTASDASKHRQRITEYTAKMTELIGPLSILNIMYRNNTPSDHIKPFNIQLGSYKKDLIISVQQALLNDPMKTNTFNEILQKTHHIDPGNQSSFLDACAEQLVPPSKQTCLDKVLQWCSRIVWFVSMMCCCLARSSNAAAHQHCAKITSPSSPQINVTQVNEFKTDQEDQKFVQNASLSSPQIEGTLGDEFKTGL